MKFDAKAAKAKQQSEHILIEACPGLCLESRASAMTWTCRYKTDAGLLKQTSIGRWPAVSSHEAVSAWLSTRDTRRQTGVDPHAERLSQRAAARAPEMFGRLTEVQDRSEGGSLPANRMACRAYAVPIRAIHPWRSVRVCPAKWWWV